MVTTPFFGPFTAVGAQAVGAGPRAKTVFMLIWGGLAGGIPVLLA